jgi:tetratricopeptide (TPR) repeat protein
MNIHLERGRLLMAQRRMTEAEQEFKQALSFDPNNPVVMALLAECAIDARRFAEALDLSQQAIGMGPTNPFLQYTLARAYFYNKNATKAYEAIQEGLRLNPFDPDFFYLEAHIAMYEEKWDKALTAAERGLEIDPEHVNLINLRAQALIKLNRKAEAAQTLDYALHKAPEDSFSHANKGWVAIESDQYDEAISHFKEALRLNPESEFAKAGLKESIKAKNILYRYILKYFLWIGKMNQQGRWLFIIGIYILYRIILEVARANPSLAPLLYPLVFVYVLFAFSSWIALPVSNLFLRLHPLGKYALTNDEIKGSNLVGTLGMAAISCLAIYFFGKAEFFLLLGAYFALMLIPIGGLYGVSANGSARKNLRFYTIALAIVGLGAIFIPAISSWAVIAFLLGIFAYGWVANYLISKDAKEF